MIYDQSNIIAGSSAERKERFQNEGVVLVRGLFNDREVSEMRDVFMDEVGHSTRLGFADGIPEGDILAKYPRFVHPHRHPETAAGRLAKHYMLDSRLQTIATELLGPMLGAQSMFYFKPPTARGQSLHQDNLSLRAHPETCLAAWIAVDEANEDNGGLMIIPGSHKQPVLCQTGDADIGMSFTSKEIVVPDTVEKVQTNLNAGDVLFFHGSLVHGSLPNRSTGFRRSLIYHYIPKASKEVAKFYQPLLTADGTETYTGESSDGGPCGEGWEMEA